MPYRVESGELTETRAELVYTWTDPRRLTPGQKAFNIAMAGFVTAIGTAIAGFPTLGGGALALSSGLAVWRWRAGDHGRRIRFVVDRGDLVVTGPKLDVRARLVDLEDVSLDTRTIRKVITGNDATPVATNTSLSPELDQSRIVLRVADREPVTLTDSYLAYMDVVEWAGKIRSFLREHGWVPSDEREEPDD